MQKDSAEDVLAASKILTGYFARNPSLQTRYRKLRQVASDIAGSNYDVSDSCNLRCEGCLYFEGTDRMGHTAPATEAVWDALFAAERARGVNFAYLAGAEPALAPAVLRLAAEHIGRGVIFTNGTVPVDPRLPFALHVSLWGDEAATPSLRGGDCYARAFRLFSEDRRARFIYTVNARNIEQCWTVAQHCARAGVRLSFSIFSPTEQYQQKLRAGAGNDEGYFRVSSASDHLAPDAAALRDIRMTLNGVVARYPDTVIYSAAYNVWVTDPAGLYRLDPDTGWALDCETRNLTRHRHVRADGSFSENTKCCTPNIDCRACRAYAIAGGTAVSRFRRFAGSYEGFCDWLDMAEQWAALFLLAWDQDAARGRVAEAVG